VQQRPDEGRPATESTTVYLIYDQENLYIAFKCYCRNLKNINRSILPRDEYSGDRVGLLLDPFDDQNTGYYFVVNAAGVQGDYSVSADFRNWDKSWDGVWYSEVRFNNFGYCVEFQIPFRTIRYKSEISEWGINFTRYIPINDEQSYWSSQPRSGIRVSLSGRLRNIKPGVKGANLEIYPVAIGRFDQTDNIKVTPDAGLDVSWSPSSATSFFLTTNPDFAQIEADPSQVNLSKYELWYPERRPFFIEDAELFQSKGIETFYSRRIGRPLPNGKLVPIAAGLKFSGKFERTEVGFLDALSRKVDYEIDGTNFTEPLSYFRVLRLRQDVLKNSNLGLLYATKTNQDYSNSSFSLEGVFQERDIAVNGQTAISDFSSQAQNKLALAHCYQANYQGEKFNADFEFSSLPENFDVNNIGFVTRKGMFLTGGIEPKFYNLGFFRSFSVYISAHSYKEANEPVRTFGTNTYVSMDYDNNWGNWFGFYYDKDYEMDTSYHKYSYEFGVWTDEAKPLYLMAGFWTTNYEFNYRRGFFAPNGNFFINSSWRIFPSLKFALDINNTTEFDTTRKIEAVSWILHPSINYALTRDLQLRIYSEIDFDTQIHYLNLLLSWNFKPKSWVYLAFNESHDANLKGSPLIERIGVLKIRYLFFF
jgi:hypothetical protein